MEREKVSGALFGKAVDAEIKSQNGNAKVE